MTRNTRFREDDRGWLPVALVGVVLFVGSVALFVGLQPDRPAADPTTDVAVERVVGETGTAVRTAVVAAGDAAARDPVLDRANTSTGRILSDEAPFRDALRLRIYLRARERLDDLTVTRGDVTATASLPATPNVSSLSSAMARVHVEAADDNRTRLRVRVENVTVTARRGNRTVVRKTVSPRVVVRTPVLAVHDRVGRFDRRLNAGIGRPGLTTRLTARLYGVVWARGYAQYGSGGAAVENVLANRHVEITTNGAILREQRHLFGRSDAAGRRALDRAMVGVTTTDLLRGAGIPSGYVRTLFRGGRPGPNVPVEIPSLDTTTGAPDPGDRMTVGVNGTADRGLARAAAPVSLQSLVRSIYSAEVETISDVDRTSGSLPSCWARQPEGWWRLDYVNVDGSEPVVRGTTEVAPQIPDGWHAFDSYGRRVRQERTKYCNWVNGNETAVTQASDTFRFDVGVALVGRHARTEYAPANGIERVHEAGKGPLDGPNLANVSRRARLRLVEGRGGPDALAKTAVREGDNVTGVRTIHGQVPEGIRRWLRADLMAFRDRVADVSVTVERGRAGAFEANPAAELHRELAGLVDPPSEYGSVAEKARFAARGVYVERTRKLLEKRAERQTRRKRSLDDAVGSAGAGSTELLGTALENRTGIETEAVEAGIDGVDVTAVEGSPAYLTVAEVGPKYADSLPEDARISPLAARNINLFASPHGDIADTLLRSVDLGSTVGLRTAARTLRATRTANELTTENETLDDALDRRSASLDGVVRRKVGDTRKLLREQLAGMGVGDGEADRRRIVGDALARWDGPGAKALALTNGSAAGAIADRAVEHNETGRDSLRATLQLLLHATATGTDTRVSRAKISTTGELLRQKVKMELAAGVENATREGASRLADRLDARLTRSVNRVPAGLPIVPAGPAWWVTVNAWIVEVRGGYDRFAVQAGTGAAAEPGGSLTYVRDGGVADVDYDGDGEAERLGHADRISFASQTSVVIAVPPGPQGVGDKDGNVDERSASWTDWRAVEPARSNGRAVPDTWPDRG
ncbi:DUF7286 family protein [Halorientalis pallida]|uniref:Uncharacterized protein n=1 Tax=Halorientalis pallida TaxID=2479928 RepID=A0A498KZ64_9EURY|nr:hypothetical protein [Halorientalis pallida]RXK48486.1 hypothetical protein EAF64_12455 [Halorientalis pallida]